MNEKSENVKSYFLGKSLHTPSKFSINLSTIAFSFWFYIGIAPALTYLIFRSHPALTGQTSALFYGIVAFFLGLGGVFGHGQQFIKLIKILPIQLIIVYSLWAGLSILWTGAPKAIALVYWLILILKQYIVLRLASSKSREDISMSSLKGYVWGGSFFALIPLLGQETDSEGRLGSEEFLHPNTIGNQLATIGLCNFYLLLQAKNSFRERFTYTVMLIIQVFTLLRSLSKTSILCFILASLVYVVRSKISLKRKILFFSAALIIFSIAYGFLTDYITRYLYEQQGGEALSTATGRTDIWEMSWFYIQQNPILGYGFQSYRYTAPQIINLRLVHAHNDAINIWYTLGAVGLTLAILVYASYAACLIRAAFKRSPQEALGLALLVYSFVRGMTEAAVDDLLTYETPLMLMIVQWMALSKQSLIGPR